MENSGSASDVGYPSEGEVRILVVDEDPLSLITLIRTLKSCGYQVTAKASPEEALREVRQKPEGSFDLVITVARTEGTGIDGFGLLEHLRNRLPVILVSNEPEPMETMMRGYLGGAFEFLTKPLGEKELRYIWKHVSRWRINAANGSDPRWRRSAGAVNGSGEGSSRGVRQQKKRCRTTRKTQFNSLPNLHALFVEAAEVLQGTEGYCLKGIRELLSAQGIEIPIDQATIHLEIYERDRLINHLSGEPTDMSSHYNNSGNYLTYQSSGSYMRSHGATNVNQLSNGAFPRCRGVLGNESYRASHVGHLHNNGNHHGNSSGYGNANANANGYCGKGPENRSMVSAPPSFNQAQQVQQTMATPGLVPRFSYHGSTRGIAMLGDGDDMVRSYQLGEIEAIQNNAATCMTQGIHEAGAAGQASASHAQDFTDFLNWESTCGNGITGPSDAM